MVALGTEKLSEVYLSYFISMTRAPAIGTTIFFLLLPAYNALYQYCSTFMNDHVFVAGGMWVIHVFCYWSINTFFWICDHFGYLSKYKLPRQKYQIPSRELLMKTLKKALIGQLLMDPVGFGWIVYPLWLKCGGGESMVFANGPLSDHKLWYVVTVWLKFAICTAMNQWLFYFAHRILHHPSLYGWIHKQHHEYKGSISFAAEYAHPIEGLLANQIPTLIGGIVTGCHPLQYWIWIAWRLQETYESHSGFAFYGTWLYSIGLTNTDRTLYHDFHHTKNIGNYAGPSQDTLFRTNNGWTEWYAKWKKEKDAEIEATDTGTRKRIGG